MKRKPTSKQDHGEMYQKFMGTPQSPESHPANNVNHPHGNRGLVDSTLGTGTSLDAPNTGAYQDGM